MRTTRLPAGSFIEHPAVRTVLTVLDRDGEEARVVGGAIRNALMGYEPGDIDFATTALPEVTTKRAHAAGIRAVPTGIEHGTVTLIIEHRPYEVTTLREDVETDGRRATVVFGRSFPHDAQRRDFTMNALYARLDGTVEDHVGGLEDLESRHVRFIGDPDTRIREDYLRILRLFRFHADYGAGAIDAPALAAAIRQRDGLGRLSAERVRAELLKLLSARRAIETVATIAETGFLDRILAGAPDVRAFAALSGSLAGPDPVLGLGALGVRVREDADRLHDRLRLSNAEGERLKACAILLEALHDSADALGERHLRSLAYRHGTQPLADAVRLDAARRPGSPAATQLAIRLALLQREVPRLPFSGAALIERGLAPGRIIGAVLARAEALWIEADFPTGAAEQADLFERALRDIQA